TFSADSLQATLAVYSTLNLWLAALQARHVAALLSIVLPLGGPGRDSGCGCPLPATGQTTCWDSNGNVISCAGTGEDGELRKGAPLAYADHGDGTVADVNTGLVWEKLSDDGDRQSVE